MRTGLVRLLLALAVASAGCGSGGTKADGAAGGSGGTAGSTDGGAGGAAATDAPAGGDSAAGADGGAPGACNPASPYGAMLAIIGINSTFRDDGISFTADGLTAFISSSRTDDLDSIYSSSRAAINQPFAPPVLVPGIMAATGPALDSAPRISSDGLRLTFSSTRNGMYHIFMVTRTSVVAGFGGLTQIAAVSSTAVDRDQYLTADERTMVFGSSRPVAAGDLDLYIAERASASDFFGAPTRIAELATGSDESVPVLSEDRLTLYFFSNRPGGEGGADIWVARRSTSTGPFGAAENLADLNTFQDEFPQALSADGCTLTYASGLATNLDLYQATRLP